MAYIHYFLPAIVLVLLPVLCHGRCRLPIRHRTDPDFSVKFARSELVLSGKVVGTRFDGSRSMFGQRAYTAELMVYCVYKGAPPTIRVNVSEVGEIFGNCPPIHLQLGLEYLVMLGENNGTYSVRYLPEYYNYISINQIIKFCGINVSPPIGNTRMTCASVKENPECTKTSTYLPPTTTTDTTTAFIAPSTTTTATTTIIAPSTTTTIIAPSTTTTTTTTAPTSTATTTTTTTTTTTAATTSVPLVEEVVTEKLPMSTTSSPQIDAQPGRTVSYNEVTEPGVRVIPTGGEKAAEEEKTDDGKKVKKDAAQTPELNRQVQDTDSEPEEKQIVNQVSPNKESSASTQLPMTSLLLVISAFIIM